MPPAVSPSFGLTAGDPSPAAVLLDTHGTVKGWPEEAERLLGRSAADTVGRPVSDLIAAPAAPDAWAPMGERRKGWSGTVTARHGDGHAVRLTVRVIPLAGSCGDWLALAEQEQGFTTGIARMMIEPLLTESPLGIAVLDRDLRFVWVNDPLTYGGVLPREKRVGLRPSQVLPDGLGDVLEEQLRRVVMTGEPVSGFEILGPSPVDPVRRHSWWNNIFPLKAGGEVCGAWYMAMDRTAARRSESRLALLAEANARIGTSLHVVPTAEQLASVVVPGFADAVAVDLVCPVMRGEEPSCGVAPGGTELRRVARRSGPGAGWRTGPDIGEERRWPPDSLIARCMRTGASVLDSGRRVHEVRIGEDLPPAQLREQILAVPIRARGLLLGVVTFLRRRRLDLFDAEDVSLGEELVARAALCLDNARRYARERSAALLLQENLLPHRLGGPSQVEVASRYLPAGARLVGGDWFDVIPLSGARVALVVGDVVGHGLRAAAGMGQLRTAVRTLADLDIPPAELLTHLDDLVVSMSDDGATPSDASHTSDGSGEIGGDPPIGLGESVMGATCLYAVYDPVAGRCSLARAGHPPPLLMTAAGPATVLDVPAGPPLGLGWLPFGSAEVDIPEGGVLALCTDGLIDGSRDLDLGLTRLAEILGRPAASLQEVCENVVNAPGMRSPSDDAALLLVRARGLPDESVAGWDVPDDLAAVARVRDLAGRRVDTWGLGEETRFTTEMIVSELVTNALRYGRGPVRLALISGRSLICEVADASSTTPRMRRARDMDEGGRGLFLVAQLASRWGTRYTSGEGKVIWTEQAIGVGRE